jgi:uncharacterized protein (DUF427 family)
MPKATWKGEIIAEAGEHEVEHVEGNVYFPPDKVNKARLRESHTHTICSWKGTASYYDVVVNGDINADAAWYYPATSPEAKHIAGYVAFWRGVSVS